jgi:excisionase family DNA binding protein
MPNAVAVTLLIAGQPLVVELDETALATIAAALAERDVAPVSPYMTVLEAAGFLRTSRQAVYDLLSAGKLARHKVGSRTLIARTDVEKIVLAEPRRRP